MAGVPCAGASQELRSPHNRAPSRSRLGSQVLVNMYNVQPFLEDCAFVPWEERKEVRPPRRPMCGAGDTGLTCALPQAGMRKESSMDIKRRSGRNKPVVYHVTDKPPPKKSPVRAPAVLLAATVCCD